MRRSNRVRRRVARRIVRVQRVFIHLVLTIVLALAVTWAVNELGAPKSLEQIIPAAVLLYIAHALWVMYQGVAWFIAQQEMQRAEQPFADWSEKPKRGRRLAIADDGELVELPDETAWVEKAKREG